VCVRDCCATHAHTLVHRVTLQAHSKAGRWPSSLGAGLSKIYTEEGLAGLRVGWVPTLFGYGAQGMFKFGLNEFFKDVYGGMIGEENLKSKSVKMAMCVAL
jgi:hypothetical protein